MRQRARRCVPCFDLAYYLAAACADADVRGLVHEQECTLTGHSFRVTSVAYSPDGKHIVSGSFDNTVKVWDSQTGTEVSHRVLTLVYHLLLRALVLTSVFGP